MHLITMAHLGEAQAIIETFNLNKLRSDVFQGENLILILTGEGPFEASSKTSLALGEFKCQQVINLGIAGALSSNLSIGEIYSVRTHYLVHDDRPAFKTFSGKDGQDCITSFERILDPEKAHRLKGIATLVDREAWGVAHAAKNAGVPFSSFKLVSDMAGTLGACELVREEANQWSVKLAEHLRMILGESDSREKISLKLDGFHFTFTTSHRFETLIKKLAIKKELSPEEVLKTLPLKDLLSLSVSPKEKTRLLIEILEESLDPFKKILNQTKKSWTAPFNSHGIQIETDPSWEELEVTVNFKVKNDQELIDKLNILKSLSLAPLKDIMEGKIHVE